MANKQNKYAITKKPVAIARCNAKTGYGYKNTKEKGDVYEQYILAYLYSEDTNINNTNRYVWLWSDIPEEVMCDVGLIGNWNQYRLQRKANRINKLPDVGCDIFMIDNDSRYLIQCKYYDSSNSVKIEDLAGWHGMLLDYPEMLGDLYYTSKLSENIKARKPNPRIRYFHKPYESSIATETNPIPIENKNKKLEPRDYQIDAYKALKDKQRTVLQLPCGMGKTLISIMLASHYELVIFISPLKAFCQQNEERFTAQLPDYKTEIVDSEGTRNIETLKSILAVGGKIALFATYKSVDVIMELWENVKHGYFIIDEFHNIPYDDAFNYDDDYDDDYEYDELDDDELEEENEELDDEDDKSENEEDELDEESEPEIESTLEEEETKSPMYKLLHSDARILFMSATPRLFEASDETAEGMEIDSEIFGEVDYSFPMGKAITEGHICDYMVYVPTMAIPKDTGIDAVIEELTIKDYNREVLIKARFIVRGCMGTGSRKCIIYCVDQNECSEMSRMIADLCNNYVAIDCWCDTITSNDSRDARDKKLAKFKEVKEKAFLCSVQILNECIDIPECDSIFITYASKSKIRNIQRLCRANRKDKKNPNKIASVFVWCDEYNELASFMKHVKEYDSRFTYERVRRINSGEIDSSSIMKSDSAVDDKKDLDSVIVGFKSVASWYENLERVKTFIDENGKRPLPSTNKELYGWLSHQIQNSKARLQIMKNDEIYKLWTEFVNDARYKQYFLSNEESWKIKLAEVKQFIDTNNFRPTQKTNKELHGWLSNQLNNSKERKQIMQIDEIYSLWTEFVNNARYKKYFDLDNVRDWKIKLAEIKLFIDTNNSRPTQNMNKELYGWLSTQITNSKERKYIMKIDEIYSLWTEFVNNARYKKYFLSNEEDWKIKLAEIKQFIDTNNTRPTQKTNKELDNWLSTQIKTSKQRKNIMKIDEIYSLWNEFITDSRYYKYFDLDKDNIKDWKNKLEEVKEFINTNNARPTEKTNKELSVWLARQINICKKQTEIMKNNEIYKLWTEFVSDARYKQYFLSNEENWKNKLEKVKHFIDTNNSRPIDKTNKTLMVWLYEQLRYSKQRQYIMKIDEIYQQWTEFITDARYKKYFT